MWLFVDCDRPCNRRVLDAYEVDDAHRFVFDGAEKGRERFLSVLL